MNNAANTALSLRDPWSLVPPVGNLDAYIAAVNRIPLLTPQEEISYAQRLQSHGDVEAAGRRIDTHIRKFQPQDGRGVTTCEACLQVSCDTRARWWRC